MIMIDQQVPQQFAKVMIRLFRDKAAQAQFWSSNVVSEVLARVERLWVPLLACAIFPLGAWSVLRIWITSSRLLVCSRYYRYEQA